MLGFATIGQVEGVVIAETTVAGCSGGQLSIVPRTHDVEVVRGDLGWSIRVQEALEINCSTSDANLVTPEGAATLAGGSTAE
eukprot:324340-Prymnesium_polylepis.1